MTVENASRRLIREFKARRTVRTGSLITTVFGDAIAPRGGTVWLGSLIVAMQEFGISERLVRTSVFRLVQDGWLQATQVGRRAYYSLTEDGRERFQQATHKIYGEPAGGWDGSWCLVLIAALNTADKEVARRELGWLGFGALSANVLAHPNPDRADLDVALRRLGHDETLVIFNANTVGGDTPMRRLAQSSWKIDEIDAGYEGFVKRFRPLLQAVTRDGEPSPLSAFLVRTLLIQEYRKVLLRDPQLPAELLPADWHGTAAYTLCRNLYRAVYAAADRYLEETMETADGPLPPPSPDFIRRFGGLDRND